MAFKVGGTTIIDNSGNVSANVGNIDGRDIAADGTKLDTIETNADVTDTTNVVASLTAGTNVTIGADGTVSSTDTNTTYSAGSGLTLTGTTFANSAPDQTVSLTGSGATTVSGTYPNFTISSTDTNTTYSASEMLTAIKTVDGAGSGLDADLLDGYSEGTFMRRSANSNLDMNQYDIVDGDSIYMDNWYRSIGSTGWYSETYGGGIYMQDTSWVRVYAGKAFYVANQIAATSNITAYYSDERLKTKVGDIEGALDKIKQLNGFYYVENDLAKENGYNNDKQQVALSAQDVQAVMPEAVSLAPFDMETLEDGTIVSKSGENYLTVDYARLVPLLVEAVKELQAEIEELKNGSTN